MIHVVKFLRTRKEEARALLPERLLPYLEKRLLPSAWYPEEDHIELCRALAKLLPGPAGMDIYEHIGRSGARADLAGVYRNMLRPGDPTGTLRKANALWHAYHDTGMYRVVQEGRGAARIELVSFPAQAPEHCRILRGWLAELLALAGAHGVEVVEIRCVHRKDLFCRWEMTWEDPA